MQFRLKTLLTALLLAALAAAIFVPAALAGPAGMMGGGGGGTGNGWCGGGTWDGTGTWGGTGMWGMGGGMSWLLDNPEALQAWLELRAAHVQALRDWYDTYGSDPTSAEAQQALHDLWTTWWNDMKEFYEKYADGAGWTVPDSGMWHGWQMGSMMGEQGWDPDHMWGTGYGAEWMMSHPDGLGEWLTMRSAQVAGTAAWVHAHAGALKSHAAQRSLRRLTARHRAQVKRFFSAHGLPTDRAGMRSGAGGWMGLGGMWGGFGW